MLDTLARPLSATRIAQITLALLCVTTAYCLAYAALAGRSEPPLEAVVWGLVNVIPWLLAFEIGKRIGAPVAVSVGTLLASLGLQLWLFAGADLPFEVIRRLPAAVGVATLLLLLRRGSGAHPVRLVDDAVNLPLPPGEIAWIGAAGNYVELHGSGRPVLHRASLAAVEKHLSQRGFVRIHRSILVNRARVARVDAGAVILDDGSALKVGARYRSHLHP